jgi:hypothetical protein
MLLLLDISDISGPGSFHRESSPNPAQTSQIERIFCHHGMSDVEEAKSIRRRIKMMARRELWVRGDAHHLSASHPQL